MINFDGINSIYDILINSRNSKKDKIAISDGNVSLTYDELFSLVNVTIIKLHNLGVKNNTIVSLFGGATIKWVVVFLSLISVGAIVVPLNPFIDCDIVVKYIKKINATCAIFSDTLKIKYSEDLKENISKDSDINVNCIYSINEIVDDNFKIDKDIDFSLLKKYVFSDFNSKATSLMIFTSGTGSEPKIACLSQYNIISSLKKLYAHFMNILYIGGDKCMIAIPLNHIYGIIILFQTLLYNFTAYITNILTPQVVSKIISDNNINSLYSVSMIFDALTSSPSFEKSRNLLTANFISGAKINKEHYDLYKKSYHNATFFNVYGTTEATGAITITQKEDYETFDTFLKGTILDGYEVAIYRDGVLHKDMGITGEIVFKSNTMLNLYYGLEKNNWNIDKDGWFHTGDIGLLLPDNKLEIIGRNKDIIIKGAENISVLEIENEILKDENIDMVAVISKPDDKYGEEIYAYITLKNNNHYDEKVLLDTAKKNLGSFKVPKEVKVLDKMPVNTLGKIIKSELKNL